MNRRLLELNPHYHAITTRLFLEDRHAMPQEQHVLDQREDLLRQRNQARDSQLQFLLDALAPLAHVHAPLMPTDLPKNSVQEVGQRDQALVQVQVQVRMQIQMQKALRHSSCYADAYRRAKAQLDGLQESAAPCEQIQKLQRLMQGYRALLALEAHTEEACEHRALLS
ncbi:hypothetical protein [Xanthomonas campestris]|uniref:hypothetical protein n=1 Tax=Xanthomonas campestris TaxID=339 RepID=UPI000E32C0A4|nr:hypothetical protein [Xanthomonas campestris]RFF50901.1 hypothetical protein D0A35_08190 [Xanthomonas campestris]